jgi:hypothetical protein
VGYRLIKFTKEVILGIILGGTSCVIAHWNREEQHYRIG